MKLLTCIITVVCLSGVAFGQNDGRSTTHVFPQFADGRFFDGSYYRSAIHISNPSSTLSSTCTVTVRGMTAVLQDGLGNFVSLGAITFTLAGNGWDVLRSSGTSNFASGYVTISCTGPVNALVIYGYHAPGGTKFSEAAVFPSPLGTQLQILSDQRDGAQLGLAIANDNTSPAVVIIGAGNIQGQAIGSTTITIPGRSQYVGFLNDILPGLPQGHLGQVIVATSGPQVATIGLRFTGIAFTTIPSSVRQATVPPTTGPVLPTITSISPSSGTAGSTVTVTIAGTNFVVANTTVVSVSGSGVTVGTANVSSTTSLSVAFSISTAATLGARSVVVITPAGTSNAVSFSVTAPPSTKPFNQTQTERLFGTWRFAYSIGTVPFTDTFRLNDVRPSTTSPGEWNIFGLDEFNTSVIALYAPTLGRFVLFNPGITIDEVFTFDFTSTSAVSGCYYLLSPKGSTDLGTCYQMTGIRTSVTAIISEMLVSTPQPDEESKRLSDADVKRFQSDQSQQPPDGNLIRMLNQMRANVRDLDIP